MSTSRDHVQCRYTVALFSRSHTKQTQQNVTQLLAFLPIRSVYIFFLLFILYLSAASLRLHFWRQTGKNPGCCVIHVSFVPSGRSWRTMSLSKASSVSVLRLARSSSSIHWYFANRVAVSTMALRKSNTDENSQIKIISVNERLTTVHSKMARR